MYVWTHNLCNGNVLIACSITITGPSHTSHNGGRLVILAKNSYPHT
jgi:hypothetical protein